MITEQAKLTDKELMDSLNARIRSSARWDLSKYSLMSHIRNQGIELEIQPEEPNGEVSYYEPTSSDVNEYVRSKATKAYDNIYSQIATDENLLKGIRAVGEAFNVDYVYRILRDAWDNDYFENKNVVDFVFEDKQNQEGKIDIQSMVEKALDEIESDIEEGGPGSGRRKEGGGPGKGKTAGDKWVNSMSPDQKKQLKADLRRDRKEEKARKQRVRLKNWVKTGSFK